MISYVYRPQGIGWEDHILGLSSFLVVASLTFVWKNPNPHSNSVPEVIVPLGVSLGLALYTLRLKRSNATPVKFEPMAKYAWAGTVVSSSIGLFWLALHHYYGLPIDVLPDKILTILSLGIAAGVLVGRTPSLVRSYSLERDRETLLVETTWTTEDGPTPIVSAIVRALAEVEGVDPVELVPLYTHVNPETFSDLRSHDGSPWQFSFFTDAYEIRVSGHGTVTVYQNDRLGG